MVSSVAIILIVVLLVVLAVGFICTWSWWKRWWNRLKERSSSPPISNYDHSSSSRLPAQLEQLDASALGQGGRGRTGSGPVQLEPLPSLSQLNVDPRESFELRRTLHPQGIIPFGDENSFYAHDWFHPPHESFPRTNLEYIKLHGKGWFGRVIEAEATDISSGLRTKKVLVKQLRDDASDKEQIRFLNQNRFYRDAKHANVLKLLGYAVESLPYLAIFEYYPLGDLKTYLIAQEKSGNGPKLIRQGVISRMAIDIGNALEYTISSGFIHEDLSARNVLVANTANKCILGDYGDSAQKFPKDYYKISNMSIPIRWVAPESFFFDFQNNSCIPVEITDASNIFSFGILLWELYELGKTPYPSMQDDEVIQRVILNQTFVLEPPSLPYVQDFTREKLYKLMLSCWNATPENRPRIDQILEVLNSH